MNSNFVLGAALGAAGLVAASLIAIGGPAAPPPSLTALPVVVATAPAAAPAAAAPRPVVTAQLAPATPPAAPARAAAAPAPPAPQPFAFRRLDIDTSAVQPEACVAFSRPLKTDGVRYEDYMQLRPALRPAVAVRDNRLCLSGLAYGAEYELELRAGLPAGDGAALAEAEKITLSLGDRPASVAFTGGTILPRLSSTGVPITTVNVAELSVKVFRVGERGWTAVRDEFLTGQQQAFRYEVNQIQQDKGALVWSGTLAVKSERNQAAVTAFPLGETVKPRKPGVYWIVARNKAEVRGDDDDYRAGVAQWVIDSDIGLTTYWGGDGLHVFARSLDSAAPKAGVTLTLVAKNNDELGRATTDADGHASFAAGLLRGAGALVPAAVMAFGADEDFTLLDLSRPAFDLADRGVSGREAPGPIDGFVWTERGIYRPGETVQLMALLRDRIANALPETAAIVVVNRPDNVEYRRFQLRSGPGGGLAQPVALSPTAPRGMWTANVLVDPTGSPVGRVQFAVQDFVPQRLKVTLTPDQTEYAPGDTLNIGVAARFLYGAPAAGLDGESEATLDVDPDPWPQYPGYRFGREEKQVRATTLPLTIETTDADGATTATAELDKLPETSRPLRANVRVAVFEPGGRSTDDTVTLKIRTQETSLGIKPLFNDNRAAWDSIAGFEVIAIDRDGERIASAGVSYQLIREDYTWQWFRVDGNWRYESFKRDRRISEGRLDLGTAATGTIRVPVQWGNYRLEVRTAGASPAVTSVRFYAGWSGGGEADRAPDKLDVASDKPVYRIGERAQIRITAPYAGEALVVVASDRVLEQRRAAVTAGTTTIDIAASSDWGPGAYALVTLIRPLSDVANQRAPVRAIGLAWLGLDTSERKLAVEIPAPDSIRPRQTIDLPLQVRGTGPLTNVYVTLAAVDEGILQLTKFATPDPAGYYYGKRRLAVQIRDDYGRLIDGRQGELGAIRQGGDGSIGGKGLEVVPTRTVALFSGPLPVDANGQVRVSLEIPDFVGELRLMAVAYDGTRVGNGEAHMRVRDALVADATLPRFLAPGDNSRLSLWLDNVDGAAGDYRVAWRSEGSVHVGGNVTQVVPLSAKGQQLLTWPLDGQDIGIGRVVLNVTGPNGFDITRDWQIQVRPGQAPVTTVTVEQVAAGAEVKLDPALVKPMVPGSESVALSIASWRGFDAASLLRSLDRYPYGCIEQTTSRALPLLYFNDVALLGGHTQEKDIETRVQDAIWRVLDMQSAGGGFGMWGPGGGIVEWLSVYATDFLLQAKAKGKSVPDTALRQAVSYLRTLAANESGNVAAYALYVLAREGQADIGRLRQFHDADRAKLGDSLSLGQLGAALALAGDRSRAESAFTLARGAIGRVSQNDYYATPLRNLAGLLTTAAVANQDAVVQAVFDRFAQLDRLPEIDRTTTQEKAWMLLATQALSRRSGPLSLERGGQADRTTGDRAVFNPDAAALAAGFAVRNAAATPVWATVSVTGVPQEPLPAASSGVSLERKFFTLDGETPDLTALKQNDRVIVSLSGAANDKLAHEFVVLDLLPAGFEIEAVLRRDGEGKSAYDFLKPLSETAMREARDDRFVAAVNVGERSDWYSYRDPDAPKGLPLNEFHVAYIVRAITPGTYTLPAATVEDMYRPAVQARGEIGKVAIAAR